jgi:hypothetical protein
MNSLARQRKWGSLVVADRVHRNPQLIYSVGTQVVTLRDVVGEGGRVLNPRGSVGVVTKAPHDLDHSYRVRFPDGVEEVLSREHVVMLAQFKEGELGDTSLTTERSDLLDRLIFRCVVGSRAYGLQEASSDVDHRGLFLGLCGSSMVALRGSGTN